MTSDTPAQKLKGTIKSIKKTEGYGFVAHNGTGQDYFFHRSVVKGPCRFEELIIDQPVEFAAVDGPKGPRADFVWT